MNFRVTLFNLELVRFNVSDSILSDLKKNKCIFLKVFTPTYNLHIFNLWVLNLLRSKTKMGSPLMIPTLTERWSWLKIFRLIYFVTKNFCNMYYVTSLLGILCVLFHSTCTWGRMTGVLSKSCTMYLLRSKVKKINSLLQFLDPSGSICLISVSISWSLLSRSVTLSRYLVVL